LDLKDIVEIINMYRDRVFYEETMDRIAYKVDIGEVNFIKKS